MNFLNCLGKDWSTYPLSQLWTWFQLGADILRLVLDESINMVEDCYRCSLFFSAHCNKASLNDDFTWWLYCSHTWTIIFPLWLLPRLIGLVRQNSYFSLLGWIWSVVYKIYISIYWNKCSINDLRQQDLIFWFLGMGVTSSNLYLLVWLIIF